MKYAQGEEKKRLKLYNTVIGTIAEMLDMPVKKAKEMVGIEE